MHGECMNAYHTEQAAGAQVHWHKRPRNRLLCPSAKPQAAAATAFKEFGRDTHVSSPRPTGHVAGRQPARGQRQGNLIAKACFLAHHCRDHQASEADRIENPFILLCYSGTMPVQAATRGPAWWVPFRAKGSPKEPEHCTPGQIEYPDGPDPPGPRV